MQKKFDTISKTTNEEGASESTPEASSTTPETKTPPQPVETAAEAPTPEVASEKPAPEAVAEKIAPVSTETKEPVKEEAHGIVPETTPAPAATPVKETPPEATAEVPKEGEGVKEEDNSYAALFPEPTVSISSPPIWIWWILLAIATILIVFLGYQIVNGKLDRWLAVDNSTPTTETEESPSPNTESTPEATASPTVTDTPAATATPTPTPSSSASTELSAVTLRVLNGSTKTGAASTAKTILEKAGYSVKSVGNAKNQDYATTIIYYQKGRQPEAEAVKAALPSYSTSIQESTLANPDMILVVIGSK